MKTEKNMRKGFGLAGKIAMFCMSGQFYTDFV